MHFVRRSLAVAAALIAVLAAAAPAFAHEEISPKTFPTGTPTFFVLSAANETTSNLTKVVITAPSGVPIGTSTREPTGWTSSHTTTAVTFTAGTGAGVKPGHFEQFGFETDGADQPGTFTFKVALTTADAKTTNVDVPVTATTGAGAGTGSTATTGTTIATTTTTGGTTATTAATVPASNTVKSRANTALVVGVIALVLALLALVLAIARRRSPSPAAPPSAEGGNW
jgi:hypothetical protein